MHDSGIEHYRDGEGDDLTTVCVIGETKGWRARHLPLFTNPLVFTVRLVNFMEESQLPLSGLCEGVWLPDYKEFSEFQGRNQGGCPRGEPGRPCIVLLPPWIKAPARQSTLSYPLRILGNRGAITTVLSHHNPLLPTSFSPTRIALKSQIPIKSSKNVSVAGLDQQNLLCLSAGQRVLLMSPFLQDRLPGLGLHAGLETVH